MRIYTTRSHRRMTMIAALILLFSVSGHASSLYQPDKNNPPSTEGYASFGGFFPGKATSQENPVLRGFGDGGGGFDDSGAGEDEGGFNDAAPVGDAWFIMVVLAIIYGIGRRSQINRRRGESNFFHSKNN